MGFLFFVVTACTTINTHGGGGGGGGTTGNDHTEWDCTCSADFTGPYYYYTNYTGGTWTFCLTPRKADAVVNDAADECVDDLIDQGFYGAVCTCVCEDTHDSCDFS